MRKRYLPLAGLAFLAACTSSTDVTSGTPDAGLEESTSPPALAIAEDTTTTSTVSNEAARGVVVDNDMLFDALLNARMNPVSITLDIEGNFGGQSYAVSETVATDSTGSLVHVSFDYTEFRDLAASLVPSAIEAENESGLDEQSFAMTMLLIVSLAEPNGEYLLEGNVRWELATEGAAFTQVEQGVAFFVEETGEAQDLSSLRTELEGRWLGTVVSPNERPAFVGFGQLLSSFLAELQEQLEQDANFRIVDQRSNGGLTTAVTETNEFGTVVFELDENQTLQSFRAEETSSLLGNEESKTFSFTESDPLLFALPDESLRIDDTEFEQIILEDLSQRFPDEFPEQDAVGDRLLVNSVPHDPNSEFQEIEDALNG